MSDAEMRQPSEEAKRSVPRDTREDEAVELLKPALQLLECYAEPRLRDAAAVTADAIRRYLSTHPSERAET